MGGTLSLVVVLEFKRSRADSNLFFLLGLVPTVSGLSYPAMTATSSCQSVAGELDREKFGTMRMIRGFSVGMQAQTMEAQISIMDQLAMLMVVKVMSPRLGRSGRLESRKRTIRRTETAQTLWV